MCLRLTRIDHGELCSGWAWTIEDKNLLAEQVAHIWLGQRNHVVHILQEAAIEEPSITAALAKSAKKELSLEKNDIQEKYWHRDGWLFQAISWIASLQEPSGLITRAPQIHQAEKGFDGLRLELYNEGTEKIAVVISEDKATEDPRETIRGKVWPSFRKLEKNEDLRKLNHGVNGLLSVLAQHGYKFDRKNAIANTIAENHRHYRVSTTIGVTENNAEARTELFKGFDKSVPGPVVRRRANTFFQPEIRTWMDDFAALVIEKIQTNADV